MNEEDIRAFIAWLGTKRMVIAGPVRHALLGTDVLRKLDDRDVSEVIQDFLRERGAT